MKREEVAFFGKISAAMTHDIRNVLAIIRESSGLMGDLLSLIEDGSFKYHQKFHSLVGTIQDQVNRGVEMATRFNQFAHSMDEDLSDVDMNELIRRVVYLMQRFARLRKVELAGAVGDQTVSIRADAFFMHRILGECIALVLKGVNEGATVTVAALPHAQGLELVVRTDDHHWPPETEAGAVEEEIRKMKDALAVWGGSINMIADTSHSGVSILFSRVPPAAQPG